MKIGDEVLAKGIIEEIREDKNGKSCQIKFNYQKVFYLSYAVVREENIVKNNSESS